MTGCSSYLLGVKNAVLVPFRVFTFKTSSVVAFARGGGGGGGTPLQ